MVLIIVTNNNPGLHPSQPRKPVTFGTCRLQNIIDEGNPEVIQLGCICCLMHSFIYASSSVNWTSQPKRSVPVPPIKPAGSVTSPCSGRWSFTDEKRHEINNVINTSKSSSNTQAYAGRFPRMHLSEHKPSTWDKKRSLIHFSCFHAITPFLASHARAPVAAALLNLGS